MAQIAIKGHQTLYKELIEILEMLGGENEEGLWGDNPNVAYYICDDNIIRCDWCINGYTLEEFLEKYPYKVGDKVTLDKWPCTITGMSWEYDDIIYYVQGSDFSKGVYSKDKDLQPYKEETVEERKYADLRLDVDQDDKLVTEATIDGKKITPPENYLIGKITRVDNGLLVEFVKKQPQLPKTYDECAGPQGFGRKYETLDEFKDFVYNILVKHREYNGDKWLPTWVKDEYYEF